MISQRPNPTALDHSIRSADAELADIEFAKERFRRAGRELRDYATAIGVLPQSARDAELEAEDILTNLFFTIETRLTETIEEDERTLERIGA